jgi:hypothetical protein
VQVEGGDGQGDQQEEEHRDSQEGEEGAAVVEPVVARDVERCGMPPCCGGSCPGTSVRPLIFGYVSRRSPATSADA